MVVSSLAQPHSLPLQPAQARSELRAILVESGWKGDLEPVLLAVHEALVNAQDHGGGADRLYVAVNGPTVVVEIWDHGPGFAFSSGEYTPPSPTSEHGRGLWLISHIAKRYEVVEENGAVCLRLWFQH